MKQKMGLTPETKCGHDVRRPIIECFTAFMHTLSATTMLQDTVRHGRHACKCRNSCNENLIKYYQLSSGSAFVIDQVPTVRIVRSNGDHQR